VACRRGSWYRCGNGLLLLHCNPVCCRQLANPHRHIREDLCCRMACAMHGRGEGSQCEQRQERYGSEHQQIRYTSTIVYIKLFRSVRCSRWTNCMPTRCTAAAAAVGGGGCRRRRGGCPLTRQQQRQQGCQHRCPPSHAGRRAALRAAHRTCEHRPNRAGGLGESRYSAQPTAPARGADRASQRGDRCWAACTAVGQRRVFRCSRRAHRTERLPMTQTTMLLNGAARGNARSTAPRLLCPRHRRCRHWLRFIPPPSMFP